ncbi:RagB/SusD family protein [Tamlana nanhaiensis]|uniref:RagB/SusD family protein n=1 Tax=Neotamlana nanhaiensis TaxID=1382798 RepID=A0A0D7VXJ4_9FLAO|nr:RagB/SusD family nutrient uptake outer membrane protein [Tamlana nanhaiensis]KJD31571.1 RagB/SusD family protein [Tamlana nanhaiensis]
MKTFIKNSRNKLILAASLAVVFSFNSCQDYLDVDPKDKLNEDQVYNDIFDADAAVIGIYGKFMGLAEKYVVLNELRADLASTTNNADLYLQELNEHDVSMGNPYANPRDFYEVINLCNDALKNFQSMSDDNRLDTTEFNERYSDIGNIRSWLYLQLGIHYGEIPYITEPVDNVNDIKNDTNTITFVQLLDELVAFTEDLPFTNPYNPNSTLVIDVDGYNTAKFFINKECLLGDLNLWKGNYVEAASHYKNVMETSTSSSSQSALYDIYRVKYADVANNNDLAVGYLRYREQDARSLVNNNTQGWRSMFAREKDVLWNTEWIWSLPFDSNFAPANPFIDLFSNRAGSYLIKPSEYAMELWKGETQRNGFSYDARGEKFTYNMINNEPVIMKYLYKFLDPTSQIPISDFERNGDWFLYRAGQLHLRYAEAANRDSQHKLADAILNFGIQSAYTVDGQVDVTDIEQTHLPFPYDFDARQGDFPYFRGDWHRNGGIRGRAYVERAEVFGDSLISIENNIIKEAGLELAYEGSRWADLLRVALRRNDPAFLADKIYNKLESEGNPRAAEVRSKLMDANNWYLPFVWKEE